MWRHYFLSSIYLSFFSRRFYRNVLQSRKGSGFSYLFFISSIASLIVITLFTVRVYNFDSKKFADDFTYNMFLDSEHSFEVNLNRTLDIISQIPRITFRNGELSTDKKEPYFVSDPVSGREVAIFDTTGYYSGLGNTDAIMLFARTKIITKDDNNVEEVKEISDIMSQRGGEQDYNVLFGILSQIPKITIKNGIASIDEHVPYNIVDEKGDPLAIVDTDGDYEPIDDKRAFLLITKDKIFIKNILAKSDEGNAVKELRIADIDEEMIYMLIIEFSDTIRTFLLWFVPFIVLPLYIVFSFVFSVIFILIISIVTLLFGKIIKLNDLEYENALRLSSFAVTPVYLGSKILPNMSHNQSIIYFLILLGYLYFAVYANTGNHRSEA